MKSIQSKSLLTLIIIFFIIGFSTSAKNLFGLESKSGYGSFPADTISTEVHFQRSLVRNPDRVVYPSILEGDREKSEGYVKYYSRKERADIIHTFNKGKKYFPKAIAIFDKYDVPEELQVLPALESDFNGNAVSKAGAVGYWQFMEELAGEYGLQTGGKNDERKNFSKSTVAAAKFLRDQLDYFDGDILLTVASFNCGTGRLASDIKKSGKKNPTFWDIKKYLPQETRLFVLRFIALNVVASNYDNFLKGHLNFEEPALIQLASIDSSKKENSDNLISQNSL